MDLSILFTGVGEMLGELVSDIPLKTHSHCLYYMKYIDMLYQYESQLCNVLLLYQINRLRNQISTCNRHA